jgi:hypothetical protein
MLSIALTVGAALATLFAVVQFLAPTRGFDAGPSQAAAPKARSGRAEVAYTTDEAHEMACLAATGAIAIERLQSGSDETGPDPRQTGPCVGGTSGKLTLEAGGSPLECVARFETGPAEEARATDPDLVSACSAAVTRLAASRRGHAAQ